MTVAVITALAIWAIVATVLHARLRTRHHAAKNTMKRLACERDLLKWELAKHVDDLLPMRALQE